MVSGKVKLLLGVLALQFCYAGFFIVSRAALNMGVSKIAFSVYRNAIAVLFLAPFAYFLEKKDRPPLTFSLLAQFFVLALFGVALNQGFYILGLYYLSPTFASAIQNSAPAITFALAAALRIEQFSITEKYGLAKVIGTLASIGGATIMTLYKGPPLLNYHLLHKPFESQSSSSPTSQIHNWTLGCIYILGNCLAWSAWMVFQVPVLKNYPARLSVTTFTCFFGLLQFLVITFAYDDAENWRINSGELMSIIYAGIVASGIGYSLQLWCIDRGGPLFVAVFQPVQTIAVAIMAALLLGDQLYSGGVIGAILIIVGLYFVLWGKSGEQRAASKEMGRDSSQHLLDENSQIDNAEHFTQ